jgi:hypothetical protein
MMHSFDGEGIALIIAATGGLITSVVSAWGVLISTRNAKKIEDVHILAQQVKIQTDGLTEKLVNTTAQKSFAEGVKSEVDRNGNHKP